MTFLLTLEILLSVCFLGVLGALLLVAAANHFYGDDALVFLDGRPAFSALDEHAHERLTLEAATEASAAYLYAERECMEWDYVLSLDAREPRG